MGRNDVWSPVTYSRWQCKQLLTRMPVQCTVVFSPDWEYMGLFEVHLRSVGLSGRVGSVCLSTTVMISSVVGIFLSRIKSTWKLVRPVYPMGIEQSKNSENKRQYRYTTKREGPAVKQSSHLVASRTLSLWATWVFCYIIVICNLMSNSVMLIVDSQTTNNAAGAAVHGIKVSLGLQT